MAAVSGSIGAAGATAGSAAGATAAGSAAGAGVVSAGETSEVGL